MREEKELLSGGERKQQSRIGTGREVKTSKLGGRGGWRGGRGGSTRMAENGIVLLKN